MSLASAGRSEPERQDGGNASELSIIPLCLWLRGLEKQILLLLMLETARRKTKKSAGLAGGCHVLCPSAAEVQFLLVRQNGLRIRSAGVHHNEPH